MIQKELWWSLQLYLRNSWISTENVLAAYVCATFHLVAVSSSNGQTARFSIEEWRNSSMQIIKPSMVVRNCIDEYMSHHSPHTLSKGA